MAVRATIENFQADVLEKSKTVSVLVDFWAEWCGPCRMIGPVLDKLERDYGGKFILAKVNTDEESELAQHFRISGIPAVKLIQDGKVKDEFTGALPEAQVRAFLNRHIKQEVSPPVEGEAALEAAQGILELPGEPDETAESTLWNAALFLMKNRKMSGQLTGLLEKIRTLGSPYSDRKAILLRLLRDPERSETILSAAADQDTQKILEGLIAEIESKQGDARIPAKDTLIACFAVMSNAELIAAYRRRLSTVWF